MPDLAITETALAEMQKTLKTCSDTLITMDQAIRGVDVAVVGADTFIQRLDDLHEALASSIWMLGEAMTVTLNYVDTADTTFAELDQKLARGHQAMMQ